jgi:hypothetical protein
MSVVSGKGKLVFIGYKILLLSLIVEFPRLVCRLSWRLMYFRLRLRLLFNKLVSIDGFILFL